MLRSRVVLLASLCALGCHAVRPRSQAVPPAAGSNAAEVDASTLSGKLLMGYQGWFGCPGDGSALDRWEHWFQRRQPASARTLHVDFWPDTRELEQDELCPTPFTRPDGSPAYLYSAYRGKTVDRHFRWMHEYGIDGVFLQRFSGRLSDPAVREFRDQVARNVRLAAEAHGRTFALMYDISGHDSPDFVSELQRDWRYVVDELRMLESPRYLRHAGRPVLAIWGLGFTDRPGTPEQAAALVDFFRKNADPRLRVTLMGGVPARWRTLGIDSKKDAGWAAVYRSFDVISPWAVGRFKDERGADRFARERLRPDLAEARAAGAEYMPVVFPGFSWHNLKTQAKLNQTPRRGGRFYWRQVFNALEAGCSMLYGAMYDEVDEGTAMYKLAATRAELPAQARLVPLDVDGVALPPDWYLRLAGAAQRTLRGELPLSGRLPLEPARSAPADR